MRTFVETVCFHGPPQFARKKNLTDSSLAIIPHNGIADTRDASNVVNSVLSARSRNACHSIQNVW